MKYGGTVIIIAWVCCACKLSYIIQCRKLPWTKNSFEFTKTSFVGEKEKTWRYRTVLSLVLSCCWWQLLRNILTILLIKIGRLYRGSDARCLRLPESSLLRRLHFDGIPYTNWLFMWRKMDLQFEIQNTQRQNLLLAFSDWVFVDLLYLYLNSQQTVKKKTTTTTESYNK